MDFFNNKDDTCFIDKMPMSDVLCNRSVILERKDLANTFINLPEWPFDTKITIKLASTTFIPAASVVIKVAIVHGRTIVAKIF